MMNSCGSATSRSRSNKSPPVSRGCSSSSSAKISPVSPRSDDVPNRPSRSSPSAPSCIAPSTDTGSHQCDQGDERPSAASPSTQAPKDEADAGDQATEEIDHLDVVDLDTVSDHSASGDPAYEPTKCEYTIGDDGVDESEATQDEIMRNRQQTDDDEILNTSPRRRTINCPQDPTIEQEEPVCLRLTKSLSGGDLQSGPIKRDRRTSPSVVQPPSETTSRLFSPFPRQHVNKRRVDNAIRLGLYTVDDMTAPQKTTPSRSERYQHS